MGNDPMPLTNMVSVLTTTLQEATSEDIVGYIVIHLKPYQIRLKNLNLMIQPCLEG